MTQTAEFARLLLEEAKRFLKKVNSDADDVANNAHLHAALMPAFCSLEGHVNALGTEYSSSRQDIPVHDNGVLLEREVRLDHGVFKLTKTLKMTGLEARLEFLYVTMTGRPLDRSVSWWRQLAEAIDLRNQLTHPKSAVVISKKEVARAIMAIMSTLDNLYRAAYQTGFPAAHRRLGSTLDF